MRTRGLFIAGFLGVLCCPPAAAHAQTPDSQLPPGEGREVVATLCTACHALQPILMKRDGPDGWRATVENMTMRGSTLFLPGEPELAVKYLTRNFGPAAGRMETGLLPPGAMLAPASARSSKEIVLPEGAGKALVAQRCGGMCHDLGRVVSSKRTKEQWERIARNMSQRASLDSPQEIQTITSYLTEHVGK